MKKHHLLCLTFVLGAIQAFSAIGDSIRYNGVLYSITAEDSINASYEVRALCYERPRIILPDTVWLKTGRGYCLTRVPYWYDSLTCALTHYSKIDMSRCEHVTYLSHQYSRLIDVDTLVLPPNLIDFSRLSFVTIGPDGHPSHTADYMASVKKIQPGIHRIFSSGIGSTNVKNGLILKLCGALQELDFSSYQVRFDSIYITECDYLEKCVFPNSLVMLGLNENPRLKEFNSPDSLELIDVGLTSINHLHLGPNVRYFNGHGFVLAYSVDSITVAADNRWLCSVDGVLFTRDTTTLIRYPYSKSCERYELPKKTNYITAMAFLYSDMPDEPENSLKDIDEYPRQTAEIIYVKEKLKSSAGSLHQIIFNNEFRGSCTNTLYSQNSEQCTQMTFWGGWGRPFGDSQVYHITDAFNFESTKVQGIIYSPFARTYIDSLKLPETLKYLELYGLVDMRELEYLDFSRTDSLQEIDNYSIAFCPKLKNIDLFHCSLVKSIGNGVFMNDVSLDSVVLPRNLENIGDSAFFGCTSLEKLICPALVPIDLSHRLSVFEGVNTAACELVVPAPSIPLYQQAEVWKDFNITSNGLYTIGVALSDSLGGTVSGTRVCLYGDTAVLELTVSEGYEFVGWSDGSTDNPRIVTATQDIVYTAIVHSLTESLPYLPHGTDDTGKSRKVMRKSNVYIETDDDTYTVTGISEK